ncbi:NAD(P)H:quinone oxidoreductase [Saccharopolyspora indica]|uniref:NAD(P)H:quinone oxidoreductase n=1 Tax=Saccharopolyspora indica TaxID=1229659 RepID=UPI0022EA6F16|nr:NAD(P)H:quinone oxidoreductase [Saccharopolyspora indica]MDA3645365.1 NAD(P)H:quinone oxidoreductase [Saccharopolyspora indica]
MTNVAVVYYSSTGNVHTLAEAAAESAGKAGAEVRLLKVAELAPAEAVESNPAWAEHVAATADVAEASLADVEWADVLLFGTPTRFGLPAAQLKQFIDTTGGLWFQGKLVNKVVSSFTSTSTGHGGQESTLLALNNTFYHWGAIIVPPGFADPVQFDALNGNPYGASSVSANNPANVAEANLAAVEFQARRAVEIASALHRGFAAA